MLRRHRDRGCSPGVRKSARHRSSFPVWIVKVALQRPYTFIVFALVIVLLGGLSILRTPTDIFPNIPIPVVATVWNYSGLSPDDMANRILLSSERTAQTTVNDVEHTE